MNEWLGLPGLRAMGDEERQALERVLARGALYRGAGLAPPEEVEGCEEELARLVGRKHVLMLNSGTSALLAALHALGVGEGDEVIVPSYGWLTNVSSVLYVGATPVFVPVGPGVCVDTSFLEQALSPRTKAITPIHACGWPCDMETLRGFARKHGLAVLDDASQALGSSATWGDVTAYSFQSFKIVTGGEGGALATDDTSLYLSAVRFHDSGLSRMARHRPKPMGYEVPVGVGLNLRMSELEAALIRVQLRRLPHIRESLKKASRALLDAFAPALASGGVRHLTPPAGATDNGTFLLFEAADARTAHAFDAALRQAGCHIHLVSKDRTHGLPGWLEYLETNNLPHRVVGRDVALERSERVLALHVNWALTETGFAQVRSAVESFLSSI